MKSLVSLVAVSAVLALGAFGCVNTSSSHDGQQSTASLTGANADTGKSETLRDRESASSAEDRTSMGSDGRQMAERARNDGHGEGPYPLPWAPAAAGAMPGHGFDRPGVVNERPQQQLNP
ncbi:MAG TPA: hypothetical protein VF407_11695 [Polyangiaceae bacterium]